MDWNYAEEGKLWTYNLNYFEYLRQPGLDPDIGEELIAAWVANEETHKDGWEPYPTSLRLVNWLQFYRTSGRPIPTQVDASIRRQYVNLWRKVEYHLGGNHLLENALALALTARYLQDESGGKKADRLLRAELKEQYLPDGSHYERSIMYHLVLLWRQLDIYSWLRMLEGWEKQKEITPPLPLLTALRTSLFRQLAWAESIITPDGRYPHFNDSQNGIAPDWSAVLGYAQALGLTDENEPERLKNLPSSSARPGKDASRFSGRYIRWDFPHDQKTKESKGQKANLATLWIDFAPIGPDDIPGHAHADSLSIVLHVNGRPFVIDPAISTYEKIARRSYERSTAAHNTVTLGRSTNSSDVWGGFRVGKRARTTVYKDAPSEVSAAHNGFPDHKHRRTVTRIPTGFRITDELTGPNGTGIARLHFAPGLKPSLIENILIVADCIFTFSGATDHALFDYQPATGWNELAEAKGVAIMFAGKLTTEVQIATNQRPNGPKNH